MPEIAALAPERARLANKKFRNAWNDLVERKPAVR